MKALGALLALAWGATAGHVAACPCSDDPGAAFGSLRPGERATLALFASARRTRGRYDALSRYSPLADGESEWSEELLGRLALRVSKRLEASGELGFASYHFQAPGIHEQRAGLGDALVRARARLVEEGMPHESFRPSAGLSVLGRAPVGALSRQRSAGYGSGGVQLGLGAWEVGLGADAARSLTPSLTLALAAEAAYRFEDRALGRARHLGPRADASLTAAYAVADWLTTAASVRLRLVGDVSLDGQRLPGTGERLWTVSGSASFAPRRSRFRSAVTLSAEPPVSRIAQGGAASLAVSCGLTYAFD